MFSLSMPTPIPMRSGQNLSCGPYLSKIKINKINITNDYIVQMLILCLGCITLSSWFLHHYSRQAKYIRFDTNLSVCKLKSATISFKNPWTYFSLFLLGFLLCECSPDIIASLMIQLIKPNLCLSTNPVPKLN